MDINKEKELYLAELLERGALKQDEIDDLDFKTEISAFHSSYLSARFIDNINFGWSAWQAAKAQAVPEGFGLFDGDTLTYSNGYSINCSFDDEFDCHVFDVSKDGCYIKTGMTQLEQAHCLVLSMIKLDAKDSMLEAQEPAND